MLKEEILNLLKTFKTEGVLRNVRTKNNKVLIIELNKDITELSEQAYWAYQRVWEIAKQKGIRLSLRYPTE